MNTHSAPSIDLNAILVSNPASTFFMRMKGDSLSEKHILDGDMLAVDRAKPPLPGCLTVFCKDGEFFCRELVRDGDGFAFKEQEDSIIALDDIIEVFGVVTGIVRQI